MAAWESRGFIYC